jgi:hypothetical protein
MLARRTELFEPEKLSSLGEIFDETWELVARQCQRTGDAELSSDRTRLAALLLDLAGHEPNPVIVKQVLLHIFLQAPMPASANRSDSLQAISDRFTSSR